MTRFQRRNAGDIANAFGLLDAIKQATNAPAGFSEPTITDPATIAHAPAPIYTPRQDIEHDLQCKCVAWYRETYPEHWQMLFAVPNGGLRSPTQAQRLKREGQTAGAPDLVLLSPRGALLLELKTPTGRQSEEQVEFQRSATAIGYNYKIIRDFDTFRYEVGQYMNTGENAQK